MHVLPLDFFLPFAIMRVTNICKQRGYPYERSQVFRLPGYDEFWYPGGDERLDAILARAKRENVDFIIHCGDFCHNPHAETVALEKYNNFEIPTYHVLGNHDMDKLSLEETVAAYGMPAEYYYFDKNGFRFIKVFNRIRL